jgi:hypothetical protein
MEWEENNFGAYVEGYGRVSVAIGWQQMLQNGPAL